MQKEVAGLAQAYETAAKKLSARAREAARELGKRVEQELAALAMEKTRVEIRVVTNMDPAEWSERGADTVAFLIAPNVGEELKPLDKIASGGELSRVALALKTCTTRQRAEECCRPARWSSTKSMPASAAARRKPSAGVSRNSPARTR